MARMTVIDAIIQHSERVGVFHYRIKTDLWRALLEMVDRTVTFIALWVDEDEATLLLLYDESPILLSTAVEKRRYYAPSIRFPAAQWHERLARDLWGVEALSACDDRALLDDGCWPLTWPLAREPIPVQGERTAPDYRPGMVPSRTALPGLLGVRYEVVNGRVEQLDVQIAPGHRGVLSQLKGRTVAEALKVISRINAAGFVAHSLAFTRAVEQAQAQLPTPRERDTRLILLEIERMSVHMFDLAQSARAAGAELLATYSDHMREALAQVCEEHGASRRLTDMVRPSDDGGCAISEIVPLAQAVINVVSASLPRLIGLHHVYASRLEGLAVIPTEMAWAYGIGGVAGRASGRYVDRRALDIGMRLDALRSSGQHEGCALARNRQRLAEIGDSITLIERILASIGLEDDAQAYPVTDEGVGVVESARGDVWYWVTLQQGTIEKIHIRDPALPLLTVLGNILNGHKPEEIGAALLSLGISTAGVAL